MYSATYPKQKLPTAYPKPEPTAQRKKCTSLNKNQREGSKYEIYWPAIEDPNIPRSCGGLQFPKIVYIPAGTDMNCRQMHLSILDLYINKH